MSGTACLCRLGSTKSRTWRLLDSEPPQGRRSCPHRLVPAASSSEPPTSVGLACRPVGAWRRHLVKRGHSTGITADSNPAGAPTFPQFRLCFRGSLRAAGCLVAIQFPRLGGCYRREACALALVLDRSYVQAENFSKFIEAAQCVSERGLYAMRLSVLE